GSIADDADGFGAVLALPPDAVGAAGQCDRAVLLVDDRRGVGVYLQVERSGVGVEPGRAGLGDAVAGPGGLPLGQDAVRPGLVRPRDGWHRRDEDAPLSPQQGLSP